MTKMTQADWDKYWEAYDTRLALHKQHDQIMDDAERAINDDEHDVRDLPKGTPYDGRP